jgi:TPR repeat protein
MTRYLIMALLMLTTPALAERDRASVEAVQSLQAYAAYKSGNFAQARLLWEDLAARGNTTAMNNLANMFEQGQGSPKDPAASIQWLRKAAELGDPVAQLNLGLAFERGTGVTRDNHEAARWFRKSAEQGDRDAQFNLGVMLATNYGAGAESATGEQRAEARKWLTRSAAQGHEEARTFIGLLPK